MFCVLDSLEIIVGWKSRVIFLFPLGSFLSSCLRVGPLKDSRLNQKWINFWNSIFLINHKGAESYSNCFSQKCQEDSIIYLFFKFKGKSRFLIHHKGEKYGEEHTLISPKNLNYKFNVPIKWKKLVEFHTLNKINIRNFGFYALGSSTNKC